MTPVMVERPKSARQACRCLLIRMFAFGRVRHKRGNISFEKDSYPLQICVNHVEVMHVLQAARNVSQLNRTSARLCGWNRGVTHKLSAVHIFVLPDKFVDVPMFHPLGDHRKPAVAYRHSNQWQDISMPEVPPGNSLSAEALKSIRPHRCCDPRQGLTLKMTSRSSLRHTRTTLMATRRPL